MLANGYTKPQSSIGEAAPALASDGNFNSILALLTAARYSNQQISSDEGSTIVDGVTNYIGASK